MRGVLVALCLLIFLAPSAAVSAYGDGSDRSLTVSSEQALNSYTYLTGDETSGSSTVDVNDASSFSADDEILVIQMQNGYGNGEAGVYEFREVESVSSGTLNLESSLENSYYSGTFADTTEEVGESTQVVRIPEYENLTIDGGEVTAPGWDGRTGGIIALRVQDTVKFLNGGKINASTLGFRGGTCGDCGSQTNAIDGGRGEGTDGWQLGGGAEDYSSSVEDNNGIGGGGDHTTSNNGGGPGAGGGHATPGENSIGDGGVSEGGGTIGTAELGKMFFGGGGGAGSDNDGHLPYPERSDGGGMVFLSAHQITGAEVYAEGKDGITGLQENAYGGNSGGGAGGTVYLRSTTLDIDKVTAKGGDRSLDDGDGEQGGAGGDGRIRLDYNSITGESKVNPSPGYTGDAPDFCDERGPNNECILNQERNLDSGEFSILEPFISEKAAVISSFSGTSKLEISEKAVLSGAWKGTFRVSSPKMVVRPGASFKPADGDISLNVNKN
jgi:hypothetical protein